jgi:hypothetical protein
LKCSGEDTSKTGSVGWAGPICGRCSVAIL